MKNAFPFFESLTSFLVNSENLQIFCRISRFFQNHFHSRLIVFSLSDSEMFTRYLLAAVVFLSLASGGLDACQTEEGGGCSIFCQCATGMQCEAGTQICRKPGKEDDPCHLTRHCGEGLYCVPIQHYCRRMANVGEACYPSFGSSEGRRCNYQKKYWCGPFTRICLATSGKGNICGFLGEIEDSGKCEEGLRCRCDTACSIRNMLRDLQAGISGVAGTIPTSYPGSYLRSPPAPTLAAKRPWLPLVTCPLKVGVFN